MTVMLLTLTNPVYYDEVTQTFRSFNYEQGHDKATIKTNNNYKMWRENPPTQLTV